MVISEKPRWLISRAFTARRNSSQSTIGRDAMSKPRKTTANASSASAQTTAARNFLRSTAAGRLRVIDCALNYVRLSRIETKRRRRSPQEISRRRRSLPHACPGWNGRPRAVKVAAAVPGPPDLCLSDRQPFRPRPFGSRVLTYAGPDLSLQGRWRRGGTFSHEAAIALVIGLFQCWLIFQHSPWRDEEQALLVAQQPLAVLFGQLRYEGHPALY